MKHPVIIAALTICFVSSLYAQDTLPKKYEFGSVLVTRRHSSFVYGIQDSPLNNFFPGVFFRYHKGNWSLRTEVNYTQSYTENFRYTNCNDCYSGYADNKVFEAAVGAEFKITDKASFLYSYSDIYYRYVQSEGNVYGGLQGLNDYFKLFAHGLGADLGLGVSIKLFKNIRISPEFGYDMYFSQYTINRKNLLNSIIKEGNGQVINATMKSKLLLTVAF